MILANIFSKNKSKAKLKRYIYVEQNNNRIVIEGYLSNPAYQVKALTFLDSSEGDAVCLSVQNNEAGERFRYEIDLETEGDKLALKAGIHHLYITVKIHKDELSEQRIIKLKTKPTTKVDETSGYVEFPVRLGRFYETVSHEMNPATCAGNSFVLYKTVKGNLSLAVNQPVKQKFELQIDNMKTKKDLIKFKGKLFTRTAAIEHIELLVAGREDNRQKLFPMTVEHLKDETEKKFGLNRYTYSVNLSLKELFEGVEKDSNIYDAYFKFSFFDQEEPILVRVGKPRFKARIRTKSTYTAIKNTVFSISPYYSHRYNNLSLQVEDFEKRDYKYLRRLMRWAFLLRLMYKRKDMWMIGEQPYKGQDTGYHFFKYVRTAHPEKNAYYVINQDSAERKNVEPYGNVLYFKSREHIKVNLFASKIITSHHPHFLYPIRNTDFKKKLRAVIVFLQHGVLGTKNLTPFYGRNSGLDADLMIVSSEKEKNIATTDLGYKENEVVVTGLSRFDSLFTDNIPLKRQILIIPTWREWLVREDIFLESEYLERYRELIFHPELKELADRYHVNFTFCLHPNMQKFTHIFEGAPHRVISQGEVNVQDLLKESIMMITDYSSVAFDFSFLYKPVVYYQFDRRRFMGKAGSHLNLDKDLPGDIVYEASDILQMIKQYADSDFQMKPEYQKRAGKFLKYKDQHSSKRIYETVNKTIVKQSPLSHIVHSQILKKVYNRFRKNKYYFPLMKRLYRVMKTILPVDERLIVFESGVGKQFTDSPRNIYEEIVRRDLPYKKVWIYNKSVRFSDPYHTKKVKRLSPLYYYYLARARMWVNNQNFPSYITKRKGTTYLQTWHGTPLKKMLHDVEHVMGRNETYLDRVTSSVRRWDYLVSPSPYATEAFRSAFRYDGEVIESGYPRNDIFYRTDRQEVTADIKGQLNLPKDKKIILYAPTFRDNETSKKNHFTFQIKMDLEKMQAALGDEYMILLRMHVVVKNRISIPAELKDFVINVSAYPDAQELLLISDILITDYSSVMFDFANTKRPMLFFTYDFETYRDMVRGFYMDFEKEAPGPFVQETDEIIAAIKGIQEVEKDFKDKYRDFYDKYCKLDDGAATKRVVDHLIKEKVLR